MKKFILGVMMMVTATSANALDINLVSPATEGGMPLMEAIKARRSGRSFDTKMLSNQHLSDLLWTAWGISSDDGRRVVPTARNEQDISLYVLLESGAYVYDAAQNKLTQVSDKDLRAVVAKQQAFALEAPVQLLYVSKDDKYGDMHAGSMYQNSGLYCASVGLNCVIRGWYDKEEIKQALGLSEGYEVLITQAVGYPKNFDF